MLREPSSQSDYQKVLEKAKNKYKDSVRGFEYQRVLITEFLSFRDYLTEQEKIELKELNFRKNKFLAEFSILEDVFGAKVLNG